MSNQISQSPKIILHKKPLFSLVSILEVGFVGIKPLKARHDVTKLNLTVPMLSFWCIGFNLIIQPMSLTLYMTWCIRSCTEDISHGFLVRWRILCQDCSYLSIFPTQTFSHNLLYLWVESGHGDVIHDLYSRMAHNLLYLL